MDLVLGEKTYVSVEVKSRILREAIGITEEMNLDSIKGKDLDRLVDFVCKIYGNKFDRDFFYDNLNANLLNSTLMETIQGVVNPATDTLETFPTK